jgi:hypothetical protein
MWMAMGAAADEEGTKQRLFLSSFGGYFHVHPTENLRENDDDSTHTWGGVVRADVPWGVLPDVPDTIQDTLSPPVRDLQTRLLSLGYALVVNGTYDMRTRLAVNRFQRHVFSGARIGELPFPTLGICTPATAWELLKLG